jgi:Zinc knuckle
MKVRPVGLPEITMETSKRWGEVYYAIKLYFHEKYGALGDIIPDIVTVGAISAYRDDLEVDSTKYTPAKLKASLEAGGILKEQFAASWRECDKANREYKKDRVAAFYVLRTLTSKEVDDELATRQTFRDLRTDDPIGLLAEIKAVVTLKCGGITLKDQELSAADFHNLKMKKGEDITGYAIRAEGLVEAMAHSGVKKTHLPTPAAQAMKFINGIDTEVDSYRQLTAHCENSLSVFGVDVYPTTLPDALRFASKYKQLTAAKVIKPEIAIDPIPGASAFVTCETAGKKMEKKTGKAGSGDTRSGPKTPTDEDDNDPHSWKKKVTCRTCGVKGHIEKECPEKTAFQEFVAQRKAKTAILCYSAFGQSCGSGNEDEETDDFVPYYSSNIRSAH